MKEKNDKRICDKNGKSELANLPNEAEKSLS